MQNRSKYFLFAFIFMLGACSKQTSVSKLAIDSWEEKLHAQRTIAQDALNELDDAPVCRADFYTVKDLKKEILDLEKKLEGKKKLKGTFKHLNYEKMPTAQAEFLKRYGEELGDYNKTDYDFSQCSDVPCLINVVYGKPEGIEGYTIYYWYLKMGHTLAIDNKIYNQKASASGEYSGAVYKFEDFLFDSNELFGFWRVANMLPAQYSNLSVMKEIQRIPKKASIEGYDEWTCGLAWSSGHIVLSDRCLEIGSTKGTREYGDFYSSLIHEMGHEIDYKIATVGGYYSKGDEWLKEGQWFTKEVVDTETGKSAKQWSTTLKAEQFPSWYAQTSPVEHFAESLALFRYDPDDTKKKIPQTTFELLRKSFYEEKAYDVASLTEQFKTEIDSYEADSFKLVQTCTLSPKEIILNAEEKKKIGLYPGLDPKTQSCLVKETLSLQKRIVAAIKLNKVEGCRVYGRGLGVKIDEALEKSLVAKITKHVKNAQEDQQYFEKLKEFYNNLSNSKLARNSYVQCYNELNEDQCYEKKVQDKIISMIPENVSFSETYRQDLVKLFLESNPYAQIKEETTKTYGNFVFASQAKVREVAEDSYRACKSVPISDQAPPKTGAFSTGEHYMVSSLYNCINEDVEKSLEFVLDNLNTEIDVKNPKERLIIHDLVKPVYVEQLKAILNEEVLAEVELIKRYKDNNQARLVQTLTSEFSWMTSLVDQKVQAKDCQKKGFGQIQLDIYYHILEDELETYLKETICKPVLSSPELKKYLEDNYMSSIEVGVLEALKYLEELAINRANNCLYSYPKGGFAETMNAKKRVACLEEQWKMLEANAYKKFKTEGLGSKYQYNEAELLARYKTEAAKLKTKIIQTKL